MAKINKLSALEVAAKRAPGRYGDGGGLWLQVSKGADESDPPKAWLFRYMFKGRARQMGLGAVNDVSLKDARELAREQRQLLRQTVPVDPIDHRNSLRTADEAALAEAKAKAVTFATAADRYIKAREAEWKSDVHRSQWENTLKTYAYPILGELDVGKIDDGHILAVLEPIWRTKTETASRLRGRIERILDWAAFRKYRSGANPARWKGHLSEELPARSKIAKPRNHPAMPYTSLPGFMGALRQRDSISARALEFTILTATRTGEAIGARWEEIDLEAKIWIVPAERTKAHKEHRVPLSPRVIEILKALPGEGDYVFPGAKKDKALSNMAMLELMRGMDGAAGLTVHGFRSSFRDWAGETTAHPREVIEHALAHQLADKAEAAYQRGDLLIKRSRLMTDWSKYCQIDQSKNNLAVLRSVRT